MPLRVAFLSAECEPWAKTGGLADVVDALARALGRTGAMSGKAAAVDAPVDVFLPRASSRTCRPTVARPPCACRTRGRPPGTARSR